VSIAITGQTSCATSAISEHSHRRSNVLAILIIGTVLFGFNVSHAFIGMDARFAVFTQHMLQTGPTFFPVSHMGPYPDYPATTILPIYVLSLLFGRVTPFVVTLPTALVSAGILAVSYLIGALRSRRWGLCAASFAGLTFAFVQSARSVSLDQYTSLVTAVCFYLVYSPSSPKARRRRWALPLLFLAGLACRGPIGLIVPAAVVCAFFLCEGDYQGLVMVGVSASVVLVAGGAGLWIAAEHQGGADFARRVFHMQVSGRLGAGGRRFLYYWIAGLGPYALAYPVALLVIAFRWKPIMKRANADHRLLFSAGVWALVVLLGMSVPADKKIRYILPCVPALALIASYLMIEPDQPRFLRWIRTVLHRLCLTVPFAAAIVCAALAWKGRLLGVDRGACLLAAIICTVLWGLPVYALRSKTEGAMPDHLPVLVAGAAGLVMTCAGIVEPLMLSHRPSEDFVALLKAQQMREPRELVFYRFTPDTDDMVLAANYGKPIRPYFAGSTSVLSQIRDKAYCLCTEDDASQLPPELAVRTEVVVRGSLAGERCVVLSLTGPNPAPALDQCQSSLGEP